MSGHRWSARTFRFGARPLAFCKRAELFAPVLIATAFGGCASFSPDGGMSAVSSMVAPALRNDAVKVSTGEAAAEAGAQTLGLLKSALSAEAAVRIALLNNKGLQAIYNELGIAEAVMVEASLPPNPTFLLRVCPDTLGRITKFSKHEPN
jgi:hypothetical protein